MTLFTALFVALLFLYLSLLLYYSQIIRLVEYILLISNLLTPP